MTTMGAEMHEEITAPRSADARLAPVLSIDGGGIRGIIPALVLAELERRAGRPIAEMFELIAGTSTGGILAVALTRPDAQGRPRWSAQEVAEVYVAYGPRIFDLRLTRSIKTAYGLINERYEARGLEEVLDRYCGESRLSESVTDILVPAYDVVQRQLFFFDSAKAKQDRTCDYPASLVARATSAAPTYFEPPVVGGGGPQGELVFVDGGLFANNPAMCAFAEAERGRFGRNIVMLSLGTGECTRPLPFEQVRHWGVAQWARPILGVVLDGVSMAIDQQLDALLGRERYWRLQTQLTEAKDDLDDATPENIARLQGQAKKLIEERSADLDRIVELLAR